MSQPLYIFVDESGDLNFSRKGSLYYTFTAVITTHPTTGIEKIKGLQFDLLAGRKYPDLSREYLDKHLCQHFHATEDKQLVRDEFFSVICSLGSYQVNSIVVRKDKTTPEFHNKNFFYPKFLGILMGDVFSEYDYSSLHIFLDGCAISENKELFKKAIKTEIKVCNPKTEFWIYFPNSASFSYLQIADYVNWAIFRKWEKGDVRSYQLIESILQAPERDLFRNSETQYY